MKTSTITAPWTIVEGDDKLYGRIKVLKTLVEKLSTELNYDPFAQRSLKGTKKTKVKKNKNKDKS